MRFSRCKSLPTQKSGKRVAIIGAGPAGLAAAGFLICRGHEVHVYDMMEEPGGLLIYGIPDFRIPKKNVREGTHELAMLGVRFHVRTKVVPGEGVREGEIGFNEILKGYDAVIIATGTWAERRLNVEGEDLPRVYPAFHFLFHYCRVEAGYERLEDLPPLGKRVAVIGAGLTAVDAAAVSKRLGAEAVYMIYRRTINEAPARRHEIENLIKAGIKWIELAAPKRFIGDKEKGVTGVELIRMRLGEPDKSGRPKPVPIEGSEFVLDIDAALIAIGEIPTPPIMNKELKINPDNTIWVDKKMRTTMKGVFAAGDVVTGPSLIGNAIASGLKAAQAVDEYLSGKISWDLTP
ncbi:MAG TPA: FAD-dependent oxidoreductase [Sulfolobales archaeon]|nr:FAD-dependent oxidoreductase [Sulfolobales archaeon]